VRRRCDLALLSTCSFPFWLHTINAAAVSRVSIFERSSRFFSVNTSKDIRAAHDE
jgi:hypothetical protein